MSKANTTATSSYDKNHENYATFRPNYPDIAVKSVIEKCRLTDKSTIVEIAAGTGIFTKELRSRLAARIYAVEPSDGMIRSFKKEVPGVEIFKADSTAVPLSDGIADAVIAAQAFHWFANHESLAEFHRLLRPGGTVCFIWNYEDFESMAPGDWQERTVRLAHRNHDDVPQYDKKEWPLAFENQPWFEPYHEIKFPYDKVIPSREFYWQYWQTRSYITALSPQELAKVKQEHIDIMDKLLSPEEVGPNGEFVAKRGTHIVWARRL